LSGTLTLLDKSRLEGAQAAIAQIAEHYDVTPRKPPIQYLVEALRRRGAESSRIKAAFEAINRMRGLPKSLRRRAFIVLAAGEDLSCKADGLEDLIRHSKTYRGGRPSRGGEARAEKAYRAARQGGAKIEAAIAAAQEAGGFKSRSRIFELKKKGGWESPT
jgi:hypothetical protein